MKKNATLRILVNIVFIVLFLWAISKINLQAFLQNFSKINVWLLVLVLILFLISHIVKAFRFSILIKNLPFKEVFIVTIYQNFFIFLLPFRLGELTYIKKLKDYNVDWKKSVQDLVLIKGYDVLVLSILAGFIFVSFSSNLSDYSFVPYVLMPLAILGIVFFDKFFKTEKITILKKIKLFFLSLLVWFSAFLPWALILSRYFDLKPFEIIFIIGLTLISSIFPINPPAGAGLINSVWALGLLLVGVNKEVALNFGMFAYSIYVFEIVLVFLFVKSMETNFFKKLSIRNK